MKTSNIISITLLVCIALSCGRKSDSDSSGSTITADLENPASLIDISLQALDSVGAEVSAGLSKTGVYLADNDLVFTAEDCNDRAEPQARSTDDAGSTDEQGRLISTHPRYAVQDFYCKIQHDTGSVDSFLGAVANTRFLLCLAGKVRYDGTEHAFETSHDQLASCMKAEPPSAYGLNGRVTALSEPDFGAQGAWNGGMRIVVPDLQIDARVLLKAEPTRLLIATLGSGLAEDAYLLGIDRAKGDVRFEGKMQRYDIKENSEAAGWSRHIRAHVQGTLDANYRLSAVDSFAAIYSEISRMKLDGSPADRLQSGHYWTVSGTRTGGTVSHAGHVRCTFDSGANVNVCADPGKATSWADDYTRACDGRAEEGSCEAPEIRLQADSDTQFFMVPTHAAFEKSSVWFNRISIPIYDIPSFRISE